LDLHTTTLLNANINGAPPPLRYRPTRDELPEPVQRVGKLIADCCEIKAQMPRRIEAIPRREQDAPLCGVLAKSTDVSSAERPWYAVLLAFV
jgi:hypothetical protein